MTASVYDAPVPIKELCRHCLRPLVVTARRYAPLEIVGMADYVYAHADDGSTECVRTRTDPVKPYSGWGIEQQVADELRRRWRAEDEAADRREEAERLRSRADELDGGAA